jgi:hypothetical protein
MRSKISFLVIAAIAVLAACHGNQGFTPPTQQQQNSAPAQTATLPFNLPGISPRLSRMCPMGPTVPLYKPPQGPFIVFVANGKLKGNTFKSAPSPLTLWFEFKIKKSTKPVPSPSTGPSPTPPPFDQPVYFYIGKYTLAKAKQTGCAFLFTTQSGKPFTGSKFAGLAFGEPQIAYPKYYKEKIIAMGPLAENLGKLSASGGKGSAKLKLKSGTLFDTAAVTFTTRIASP